VFQNKIHLKGKVPCHS